MRPSGSRRSISSACPCRRLWRPIDALTLEPSRLDARRVAVRVDRGRGVVYLVYLPDREIPGESIVLRLRETRPIEPALILGYK